MIYNLKNIKEFLINYHRKLNLFKFSKYNFYFNNILFKIHNIKASANTEKSILRYRFLILENNIHYKINLVNLNNIYFTDIRSLKLFLPSNFVIKISIWYYILYNKYVIYLSEYLYNLILRLNYINIKYPLLLLIIRYVYVSRLDKINNLNKNKYSSDKFRLKFNVISSKNKLIGNILIENIKSLKLIYQHKTLRFLVLLTNNNIFKYIKSIWSKSSKINLIYNNYINIITNTNLAEVNKFNILGLYSLYWQIQRYGLNYEYYSYNYNIINLINNNSISLYNNTYYRIILLDQINIISLLWYKIKNVILLNYIHRIFYKYNSKFKLNKYNKYIYNKYLTRIISNYVFKFIPLDTKIYYNITFLKDYIKLIKNDLDYICSAYLFNIKYNKLSRNNLNPVNIINNINLDTKINKNLAIYNNFYYYLLRKILIKYYLMNWNNILININNFNLKILAKIDHKKNYSTIYSNYILVKAASHDKFDILCHSYDIKYQWVFEQSIVYHLYLVFLNIYYKLLLLMINNQRKL